MEAIEATTLKGDEKKAAVVELVRSVVIDAPIDSTVEGILLEMIDDGIIMHTIDIVISASKGKLHVNALTKTGEIVFSNVAPHIGKCIKSCLPCKN